MCTLSKRAPGTGQWGESVPLHLGLLTLVADSGPLPDICIDAGPYISTCYETLCGSYSWVRELGTCYSCGCVTQDGYSDIANIASGTASSLNGDCEDCRRAMSRSVYCATAIALKSMMSGESSSNALVSILDKVSAGMLSTPFARCRL